MKESMKRMSDDYYPRIYLAFSHVKLSNVTYTFVPRPPHARR